MARNVVSGLSVLLFLALLNPISAQSPAKTIHEITTRDGIRTEYWIERPGTAPPSGFHEGDDVVIRIALTDQASGSPLAGPPPAGWLYSSQEPQTDSSCNEVVKRMLSGGIFSKPDLDLNAYYVLAMNDDASITVVDPLFGYSSTKLLAMIPLSSRGEDWALMADQRMLFVSMPEVHQIAAIDTTLWKVVRNIDIGNAPGRIALQPDQHYLWVGGPSGMLAISTADFHVAARISMPNGVHEMAFDEHGRFVFVTNSESDSVSVIDLARLRKIVDVPTGRGPLSIAYSPLSQMVYAAHEDGEVAVIDAKKFAKVATMKLDAGLRQIRIAPGGRRGFAANPTANRIYIFDTASNRVIHRAAIDGGPDQVAFSDSIAYVHRLESEIVQMIPLDSIGAAGQELQTIDFPAGRYALGLTDHPSPADSIVPAPGEPAVLVSNSADKAIYFYKEGMAAPMGSFSNYSHQPRAVLVVDHSLKQRSPGIFEAVAQLPKPGPYGLALFLNSPRMVQCFEGIHIDPNAELEAKRSARVADIEPLFETRNPTAGQPVELRFRVLDHETKQPKTGIRDLRVLVYHASGTWQWREWAAAKDAGIYTVQVTLPRAGAYHVTLECPSLGVGYNKAPDVIIEARE